MVALVYRGRTHDAGAVSTVHELLTQARAAFDLSEEAFDVRLLAKGKQLAADSPLPAGAMGKVMVMATSRQSAEELNASRADPTVRGFVQEDEAEELRKKELAGAKICPDWGSGQDPNYRFSRIEAVSWQQFGHRPGSQTPHAFAARQLLEKLAADPGVVACMRARELVVGTLGEMDPIDDRLMKAKRGEGGDLLGYNTNHGMRIDIKLRTDDLAGFMPYPRLVETLIHELAHNWVGPHNKLFWTLFAQMRVEYLHEHMRIAASGTLIDGVTTASRAGVHADCAGGLEIIARSVLRGLAAEIGPEMAASLEPAVREHCAFVSTDSGSAERGRVLGGSAGIPAGPPAAAEAAASTAVPASGAVAASGMAGPMDARARAAAAAEARAAGRHGGAGGTAGGAGTERHGYRGGSGGSD